MTDHSPSSSHINNLKREAKKTSKQEGMTHLEALDRIAAREGFPNWWHLQQSASKATASGTIQTRASSLKFTVEASYPIIDDYRLTNSGKFRALDDLGLESDDKVFSSVAAARDWIRSRTTPVSIEGKLVPVASGFVHSITDDVVYFKVRVHRDSIPEISEDEIRSAIATAPEPPCMLLVALDGHVRAIHFDHELVSSPDYAVRIETLDDPASIAASDSEIDDVVSLVLEGWRIHLATGKVGVYSDYSTTTDDSLREDIRRLTTHGSSPAHRALRETLA